MNGYLLSIGIPAEQLLRRIRTCWGSTQADSYIVRGDLSSDKGSPRISRPGTIHRVDSDVDWPDSTRGWHALRAAREPSPLGACVSVSGLVLHSLSRLPLFLTPSSRLVGGGAAIVSRERSLWMCACAHASARMRVHACASCPARNDTFTHPPPPHSRCIGLILETASRRWRRFEVLSAHLTNIEISLVQKETAPFEIFASAADLETRGVPPSPAQRSATSSPRSARRSAWRPP